MSSPFSTIEEFNGAIDGPTEGAIYTFANSPAINAIALLVAVGLFLWFMAKTYTTAHPEPSSLDNSISRLSSFIVAGVLSLAAADHLQRPSAQDAHRPLRPKVTAVGTPLALLGMVGLKLPSRRRRSRFRRR